jgi:hypothetical protein
MMYQINKVLEHAVNVKNSHLLVSLTHISC